MSQSYIILAQVMPIEIDLQRRPIYLGWSSNRFLGHLLAHAADRKRDGSNHKGLPPDGYHYCNGGPEGSY